MKLLVPSTRGTEDHEWHVVVVIRGPERTPRLPLLLEEQRTEVKVLKIGIRLEVWSRPEIQTVSPSRQKPSTPIPVF